MKNSPAAGFDASSEAHVKIAVQQMADDVQQLADMRTQLIERALRRAGSLLVVPIEVGFEPLSVLPVLDHDHLAAVATLVRDSRASDRGVPIAHAAVSIERGVGLLSGDALWRHVVIAYALGLECGPDCVLKGSDGTAEFEQAFAAKYRQRLEWLIFFIQQAVQVGGNGSFQVIEPL